MLGARNVVGRVFLRRSEIENAKAGDVALSEEDRDEIESLLS